MPRCLNCGNKFEPTRFLQKHCGKSSSCIKAEGDYQREKRNEKNAKKKPSKPLKRTPLPKPTKAIRKASKKQAIRNLQYAADRIVFLGKPENKYCFIEGCGKFATQVEHSMGRKGYADDWARENGIWLINDIRFFKPCCAEHNLELENNSELSNEYQLSKIHGGKKIDKRT